MKIINNEFLNANFFSEGMVFCLEILINQKLWELKLMKYQLHFIETEELIPKVI